MRHASNLDLVGLNGGTGRGRCTDSSILIQLVIIIIILSIYLGRFPQFGG